MSYDKIKSNISLKDLESFSLNQEKLFFEELAYF